MLTAPHSEAVNGTSIAPDLADRNGGRPWFRIFPADFLSETAGLTAAQMGVLIRLLSHECQEGSLPADPRRLARLVGMRTADFRRIFDEFPQGWLRKSAGRLHSKWLQKDAARYTATCEERRVSGRKGGLASGRIRKQKNEAIASKKRSELRTKKEEGPPREQAGPSSPPQHCADAESAASAPLAKASLPAAQAQRERLAAEIDGCAAAGWLDDWMADPFAFTTTYTGPLLERIWREPVPSPREKERSRHNAAHGHGPRLVEKKKPPRAYAHCPLCDDTGWEVRTAPDGHSYAYPCTCRTQAANGPARPVAPGATATLEHASKEENHA
jgi:uncharacterized protein YdaU (DUF1376 family)